MQYKNNKSHKRSSVLHCSELRFPFLSSSAKVSTLFLVLTTALSFSLHAQNAVSSTGGTATSNAHVISYTVGQATCTNIATANHVLTEGVQQPYTVEELSITDVPQFNFEISAYPNPATNVLNLKRSQNDVDLDVELYTVGGQKITSSIWHEEKLVINLGSLKAGIYCIRIFDKNGRQKVYRITKS